MRVTFLLLLAAVAAPQAPSAAPIDRLAWLQGCWAQSTGDRVVDEQWMGPRGGAMMGMSRTAASGLLYEAHPSGQKSATFPVKEQTDASIVFEDLAHDFPQRIGYRRDGADAITAWIEGTTNGRTRKVEYPYRHATCSAR